MKILTKRAKNQNKNPPKPDTQKLPFTERLYELRHRLFYIVGSIGVFSIFAYSINRQLVSILLKPTGSQRLIDTSPVGGIDFLFRICLFFGIALSIPVIVYQLLRYLEPLYGKSLASLFTWGGIISGCLAFIGMLFGYFIGLPATMHLLLHQFSINQSPTSLTIQSYMSFAATYMLASALLFQIPLVLLLMNRLNPLSPKILRSMKYERWVIGSAFIFGVIMNPNPNLIVQSIIILPLVTMYQVGILLIWRTRNKKQRPQFFDDLHKKDNEVQSIRIERFAEAKQQWQSSGGSNLTPEPLDSTDSVTETTESNENTVAVQQPIPVPSISRPVIRQRPMKYLNDFRPARDYGGISQRQTGGA